MDSKLKRIRESKRYFQTRNCKHVRYFSKNILKYRKCVSIHPLISLKAYKIKLLQRRKDAKLNVI